MARGVNRSKRAQGSIGSSLGDHIALALFWDILIPTYSMGYISDNLTNSFFFKSYIAHLYSILIFLVYIAYYMLIYYIAYYMFICLYT